MERPVRVGVVGVGAIGPRHLKGYRLDRRAEVAAVCDVHRGRAHAAAAEFGAPNVFTNHRKLLEANLVDAISVCTPNSTHLPITLAALRSGVHVLCEKPLAMNAREGRRMVAAADRAKRILMTAQGMRYGAEAKLLKQIVEAGRLGDIYYAKAMMLRRAGIPKGWFQDARQSGGGPLIDLGVHMLDLAWWIMGRPDPVSAFGVTFDRLGRTGQGLGDWGANYGRARFSVEDLASGLVRFADGRAVNLETSWAAHTGDLYLLRFFGTKGGAQVHPKFVVFETNRGVKLDTTPHLVKVDPYAAEVAHFISCIRDGGEPTSPGSQAVVVMEMLDAIYRSARTGRSVSLARR